MADSNHGASGGSIVDRIARAIGDPTPTEMQVGPSAPQEDASVLDRREALASVLQALTDDLKGLIDAGATDLTEQEQRIDTRRPALPRALPVEAVPARVVTAGPAPAAARVLTEGSAVSAPAPTRHSRRTGRGVIAALVLAALFVAGVVAIAGTGWLRSDRSQSPAAPATGVGAPRTVARLAASQPHAFGWAAVPKASYYRVRFFRASRLVFEATPAEPRLVLPARWRFAGRRRSLVAGTYHWVVQPGFGSPTAKNYGKTIVAADWVATR